MVQVTKALAVELAFKGVRVNAIAPGWFVTEINDKYLTGEAGDALKRAIPMGRFGKEGDLDGALLLLGSDAGSYITGATIVADGGQVVALKGGQRCDAARIRVEAAADCARLLGSEAFRQLVHRDRRAVEKPCTSVQPSLRTTIELLAGLDAFGRRRHAQAVGQSRHRLDDGAGVGAFAETLDEAAVDLDLVEREAAQDSSATNTGAEIVHRDADAERPQLMQHRERHVAVLHQHGFGDLELEPVGPAAARRRARRARPAAGPC